MNKPAIPFAEKYPAYMTPEACAQLRAAGAVMRRNTMRRREARDVQRAIETALADFKPEQPLEPFDGGAA